MKEDLIPVPRTTASSPESESNSPDMAEVRAQQAPVTNTQVRFTNLQRGLSGLGNIKCDTCDSYMHQVFYLNTKGIPTKRYVPGSHCAECGVFFQQQRYWTHSLSYSIVCKYKELMFCRECCGVKLAIPYEHNQNEHA